MFGNHLRIERGADWTQVHVATDSWAIATLLVAILLLGILLASTICYYVTRSIMLSMVNRLARKAGRKWLIAAGRHKVFHRLAPLVPAAIVYASAPTLSGLTFPLIPALGRPIAVLAACYMVYTLV
jgi:miniconductance mechanosensitive channel